MMADWMIYCALWSLSISAAALLAERILRRGSSPLRTVWLAAVALSIAGPVIGYYLPRAAVVAPVTQSRPAAATVTVVMTQVSAMHAMTDRATAPMINVVAVLWPTLSLIMLLYVVAGFVRLHRLRRGWRAVDVGGTRVMVSKDTGPAVVGLLRPTIVIPEWVLGFDARRLSLILRHESEHQRAGDACVLALAQLAIVATPWNPIVWWQVRRLRLAIELDCDARVLRAEPDVQSYGSLLLEVGRPRNRFAFAGASLTGHAGDLEQRIRMMTRRVRGVSKLGAGISATAGMLAIIVGCSLPAPNHPAPATTPAPATASIPAAASDSAAVAKPTTSVMSPSRRAANNTQSDSAMKEQTPELVRRVRAILDSLRARTPPPDTSVVRLLETKIRQDTDSIRAWRAIAPYPAQSDSEAAASAITACSAGAGSDDAYVIKLLAPDSLARRDGQITITGEATNGARETAVRLDDPEKTDWHLMRCGMIRAGTLRLYGPEAFDGRPIVVNVTGPTSLIVTTGSGRLLAGPIVVMNENRKYQMTWSASPR